MTTQRPSYRVQPLLAALEAAFDYDRGDPALDRLARLAGRILGAPVALVSLVGERRQNFVGLTGIEDRGTPIELSICRLAVLTDGPVVIEDAGADDRAPSPTVEQMGVNAYAGVPVHAQGRAVGAICAIDHEPRRWSPDDVAILEDLAATAEAVIEARLAQQTLAERARRDGEASAMLQRSLLPAALPEVPAIRLAAAFEPAANLIGGDYYDAFRLPDDRLAFALGDVVGHGLEAAAAASQLRNVMRTSALEDASPAFVAGALNDLAHQVPLISFSSVVYAVVDPAQGTMDWVNLGHPPALLRGCDGSIAELAADHPVLGVLPEGTSLPGRRLPLDPGTTLLVYTDGLIERRAGDDLARVAALQGLLGRTWDPQVVVREALALGAGVPFQDDVAVFCLHREG